MSTREPASPPIAGRALSTTIRPTLTCFGLTCFGEFATNARLDRFTTQGTALDRPRGRTCLARHLPLGDGIVITGDDCSTLDAVQAESGESVVPAQWLPSNHALRECLALQAEAVPVSLFGRLFGVDPLSRDARRSYSGALAEIALADSFAALGAEWTVVHSVPVGGGLPGQFLAIDHLLIGPAGLFSITVHSHAGQDIWVGERTFLVDHERLGHLAVAEEAASAASRLLTAALAAEGTAADIEVTPCVVVDSPATLQIRQHAGRTRVTTARNVTPWLMSLPRLFSPAVVDALAAATLQLSTWPVNPEMQSHDVHRQRDDFDRLRLLVASARLRRLIWAGVGVIVSYTAVIANVAGMTVGELSSALGS